MLEDELKKTFEQLNIEPRPSTFNAVDIVFRGTAVKRRRRTYAVAATGTGTAVVAVVIAFALNQPPKQGDHSPAGPPGPDVSTSSPMRPSRTTSPEQPTSLPVETPAMTTTNTTSPIPTTTTNSVDPGPQNSTTATDLPRTTTSPSR
ncbi:hypothetical protein LZG04_14185 [Saccharothrix sp. S26]|uniref:hypothetical protein n=1 Tax=Saccharothrix sp. S26 TaxID=2907215 RepID=UPI001F480EE2|nr:hypothetical protein [Saccharothrix sp. S26]MCE6995942.1 hypothetical protein [Saccharothrix sp. S26]